jgi:hypothetical protein
VMETSPSETKSENRVSTQRYTEMKQTERIQVMKMEYITENARVLINSRLHTCTHFFVRKHISCGTRIGVNVYVLTNRSSHFEAN